MATFSRFLDLPRELRDMIWNLLVREDRPGVQIFGRYDKYKDYSAESCPMIAGGDWFSGAVSAPSSYRYFESLRKCRRDNISTYMIDRDLWTACKDSRLFMERHFQRSKWPGKYKSEKDQEPENRYTSEELFKMSLTGFFKDFKGNLLHYVTVFPHRDLFVWQLDAMFDKDRYSRSIIAGISQGLKHGFNGVHHIAIEYNEKWYSDTWTLSETEQFKNLREFKKIALDSNHSFWKLWFIDRNLRRKKGAPPFKEKTDKYSSINAFYASDRKFLEVDYNLTPDAKEEKKNWEYIKPPSWGRFYSSRSFLRFLTDFIWDEDGHDFYATDNEIAGCRIGLLGWAEL